MKRALAILGWVGVALVVAAVILRFTQPDLLVWSQRLAIAGLVTTLLYTLGQWREIARSFQGKNVRYGSMTAGSVVLVLAILVGINWISNRQNTRWDLTSNQQFSLSEQSIKVVRELQAPVTIRAFHATGQKDALADRLGEYADLSNNVRVEYFDVDASPIEAQKYEVQQYGTLIFDYNGRTERTTMSNEQDITNALIKVVTGAAKKIYFLQGHGERDSAGTDPRGFGQIAEALKGDNFETATLALAQTGSVPADANVVIIAGPTTDLLPGEIDQLKAYLDRGGKLFVMIDPPGRDQAQALPNLMGLVQSWGFQIGDNMVLDMSGMGRAIGTGPEVPLAMRYPGHPITEGFRVMTAFPLSRSVNAVEGGVDGKLPVTIVETSPQSWGESDIKGLYATGKPGFDPKTDKQGPISIGAAVSAAAPNAPAGDAPDAPKPEARMVVFGDSDFASNGALGIQGNRDLVLNTANWLAQQENLIAIRAKDPADRRVQLTEDEMNRVFWLALGIFPLALIGIGVRVWWTRR